MLRYRSQEQLPLKGFETAPDRNDHRAELSEYIPWDALADGYYRSLSVFVEIRKRMGHAMSEAFPGAIAEAAEEKEPVVTKWGIARATTMMASLPLMRNREKTSRVIGANRPSTPSWSRPASPM